MFSRRRTATIGLLLVASMLSPMSLRPALALGPAAPPSPAPAAPAAPAEPTTDPDRVEAQRLFDRGSDAYNLGNFEAAIESFERAYELTQANALLYNIAQAYTKLFEVDRDPARLRKAKVMFLNFAKIAEATQSDPRDARLRITQIDEQLADLAARQAEARARAEQAEAARLEAQRIENQRIAADTRRLEAETRAEVERRYRPRPLGVVGYVSLGAGFLGGITMLAVGGASSQALTDQRTAEEVLPLPASREALYDDNLGKARALSFAGLGVGLGLMVAGITMISVDAARRRRGPRRAAIAAGGLVLSF